MRYQIASFGPIHARIGLLLWPSMAPSTLISTLTPIGRPLVMAETMSGDVRVGASVHRLGVCLNRRLVLASAASDHDERTMAPHADRLVQPAHLRIVSF